MANFYESFFLYYNKVFNSVVVFSKVKWCFCFTTILSYALVDSCSIGISRPQDAEHLVSPAQGYRFPTLTTPPCTNHKSD
jgi:hypothetical protein